MVLTYILHSALVVVSAAHSGSFSAPVPEGMCSGPCPAQSKETLVLVQRFASKDTHKTVQEIASVENIHKYKQEIPKSDKKLAKEEDLVNEEIEGNNKAKQVIAKSEKELGEQKLEENGTGLIVQDLSASAWTLISSSAACEVNSEGIVRTFGDDGFTLAKCKSKCEASATCNAIDFYTESGWCNNFDRACTTPQGQHDGATSYKKARTTQAPPAAPTTDAPTADPCVCLGQSCGYWVNSLRWQANPWPDDCPQCQQCQTPPPTPAPTKACASKITARGWLCPDGYTPDKRSGCCTPCSSGKNWRGTRRRGAYANASIQCEAGFAPEDTDDTIYAGCCTACAYAPSSSACATCSGYSWDGTRCKAPPTQAPTAAPTTDAPTVACADTTSSNACATSTCAGYAWTGASCQACADGDAKLCSVSCAGYGWYGANCKACASGFSANGYTCPAGHQADGWYGCCTACKSAGQTCGSGQCCVAGSGCTGGVCKACASNITANGWSCPAGYAAEGSNGCCTACASNCKQCLSKTDCTQCNAGYAVSGAHPSRTCQACASGIGSGSSCPNGYVNRGNDCCIACTSGHVSKIDGACPTGYADDGKGCCQACADVGDFGCSQCPGYWWTGPPVNRCQSSTQSL